MSETKPDRNIAVSRSRLNKEDSSLTYTTHSHFSSVREERLCNQFEIPFSIPVFRQKIEGVIKVLLLRFKG